MLKGSQERETGHPVHNLFVDRWSPRALSGEAIPEEDLLTMMEAARWAPSAFNNQPWRILYARRGSKHWQTFFDLLIGGNPTWADKAAALVVFLSKKTFDHNGQPSQTHSYDTGAAWENLALQGTLMGYVVHGMQGFDYERARTTLNVPDEYEVEAMAAIGKPGAAEDLPEKYQKMEKPNSRKPLAQIAAEGPFAF